MAEFTTKTDAEIFLAVMEEHNTAPNVQTNLTYPPVSLAEHCICPLWVNRLQDALFYSLLIFFMMYVFVTKYLHIL